MKGMLHKFVHKFRSKSHIPEGCEDTSAECFQKDEEKEQ